LPRPPQARIGRLRHIGETGLTRCKRRYSTGLSKVGFGRFMQVVLHAGAHVTDEDRLITCLVDNSRMLLEHGTYVPPPNDYRIKLRDTLSATLQDGVTDADRVALRAQLIGDAPADRLVLSNDSFFGTHKMAVKRMFYPAACARMEAFRQLFPRDRIELFFAIRDPATFMPALLEMTNFNSIEDIFRGYDPFQFRWSELFQRLRTQMPDIPITVWCNEDTPLIWTELLREMAGVEPTIRMDGEYLLLREIMTAAGMKRFLTYMDSHPNMTEIQTRRVIAAFLDKFADDEAIEEELDLPGWTETMVDELSEAYDEDIFTIARIPGITLITP